MAKTATYTRAYVQSSGFLTLLSDGERLAGAYALGPEAGEWLSPTPTASSPTRGGSQGARLGPAD